MRGRRKEQKVPPRPSVSLSYRRPADGTVLKHSPITRQWQHRIHENIKLEAPVALAACARRICLNFPPGISSSFMRGLMVLRILPAGAMLAITLLLTASLHADELPADEPRRQPDADAIRFDAKDWPWWRGPERNGIAGADEKPPLTWSESENVLWKIAVPGRGHGSPIVVGDQVFLATAEHDKEIQSLLCFDRRTGKRVWQTAIHRGGFEKKGNAKSSLASSTAACDGQRVFVNFLHDAAIYTTALDRNGKQLWQTKVADYLLHQGFGSSPAVYQSLVLVTA